MKDFDMKEPLIFKLIPWIIGFCLMLSIGGWITFIYATQKIISDPAPLAEAVGKFAGQIKAGFEKGQQP